MEIKDKNESVLKGEYPYKQDTRPLFEFPILDGKEAARWDEYSIQEKGVNSRLLMGWAGYSMFLSISRESWFNNANQIHILAGSGNNGGDGYVLAWQILAATGKKVIIWQLSEPVTVDAKYFMELCAADELKTRTTFQSVSNIPATISSAFKRGDIVVDAIFGTGLNKSPSEALQNIFKQINSVKHITRIAVDIPSGVYANGDFFNHTVFQADFTYSFGSYKFGHLLEPGILSCGELTILPVGFFPYDFRSDLQKILTDDQPNRRLIKSNKIFSLRNPGGHKYESGVIHVLGGSSGMEGAALMSARAFLSLGGGLAKIYSPAETIKYGLQDSPELMIHSNSDMAALESAFLDSLKGKPAKNVAVIGVGLKEILSQKFWEELLVTAALNVIIDGSGLGQLIQHENLFKNHNLKNLILTPHKTEAEKLLGKKISNIRNAALEIGQKYNTHVYLKGPGGILVIKTDNTSPSADFTINPTEEIYLMSNHYELSTGGTGDILCGVIANMLYRNRSTDGIEDALHIYFEAAKKVIRGNFDNKDFLTPGEMIKALRSVINAP